MCKFIALAVVGLFIASSAWAVPPVKVEKNPNGSGMASGTMAAVMNHGGSMDCASHGRFIWCKIVDEAGEQALCVSGNPDHVATVRGMPDMCGLYIQFNGLGRCTTVISLTGSQVQPD